MRFEPNWASAPGATIARLMDAKEIPFDEMASGLGMSENKLQALIDGRARIDAPLASALSENLGSTPRFLACSGQDLRRGTIPAGPSEQRRVAVDQIASSPINAEIRVGRWQPRR